MTASEYTDKSSIVAYDNVGNAITLDMFMTKTGAETRGRCRSSTMPTPTDGAVPLRRRIRSAQDPT